MKFSLLAVAATLAVASAADCNLTTIAPLLTDPNVATCTSDSGFSFTAPSTPTGETLTKVCASTACKSVLTAIKALGLGDCTLVNMKLETDLVAPIQTVCASSSSTGSSAGAATAGSSTTATSDSKTATSTDSSSGASASTVDTPAATTTTTTPAPTTKSSASSVAMAASAAVVAVAAAILNGLKLQPIVPALPKSPAVSLDQALALSLAPQRIHPSPSLGMSWLRNASLETRTCVGAALVLTASLVLGFTLDANAHIPEPWNRVSSIFGWINFSCWSASFYPQVLLNHARRSVVGLSMDYVVLGLLGFVCYAIFNCAFYYSEDVQQQYMRRNNGNRNAVEVNDVFFSIHATLLVLVSLFQSFIYPRGDQRVSKATIVLTVGLIAVMVLFGLAVVLTDNNGDRSSSSSASLVNTLNLLYLLSYVKLALTLGKCIPQIVLNYQRKSTVGWAIWNVYLGIAGGVFSIAQQVLDSAATRDWTAITGDPVKFSLGFVSIAVDVVFFLQHYIWYSAGTTAGTSKKALELSEKQPLLPVVALVAQPGIEPMERHH